MSSCISVEDDNSLSFEIVKPTKKSTVESQTSFVGSNPTLFAIFIDKHV